MKKMILLLLLIFIPINIYAKDTYIDNYYIDIDILDNGDINVKELFTYKGKFNNALRNIPMTNSFNDKLLENNNLYFPTDVELLNIKDIEVDSNINFDYIYKNGENFIRNDNAIVGSKGYYSVIKDYKNYTYKIFNPGNYKGFYIEYLLKNIVVSHNDISELWLDIIKDSINIKNLEIKVNLKENNNLLNAWFHSSLSGILNLDNENKYLIYKDSDLRNLNMRIIFDKINSEKNSNIIALDKIVNYENLLIEQQNILKEQAIIKLEKQNIKKMEVSKIINYFSYVWLLGLFILIYYIYRNYDKEYASSFKGKYFKQIPNDINPVFVSYLVNKKIGIDDLSATILNMISDKKIKFIKKDDNYILTLNKKNNIDILEKAVIDLLFADNEEVKIEELKNIAIDNYNVFLNKYNHWLNMSILFSKEKNYYEYNKGVKIFSIIYSLIGFLSLFMINEYSIIFNYLIVILGIISFIYFINYTKRTMIGNEEYFKWIGLKNYINDFEKIDIKELLNIKILDKYLVYSISLGCSKKLIKILSLKFKDFDCEFLSIIEMNNIIVNTINSCVTKAKSSAVSKK